MASNDVSVPMRQAVVNRRVNFRVLYRTAGGVLGAARCVPRHPDGVSAHTVRHPAEPAPRAQQQSRHAAH
jgi:hypothetical protein